MLQQRRDAFIDREQSLAVTLVVLADVERAVVREVDSVPAVALVLRPHRSQCFLAWRRVPRRRPLEALIGIAALVTSGRYEVRMHCLVRHAHIERAIGGALFEPLHRVVGELVGDVTLLRDAQAIDVETRLARQVRALAGEADPMIEPTLRRIAFALAGDVAAHVPFADERGLVARLLQVLRKEDQRRIDRMIVVHDAMLMRVEPGEDGCARRRAERRRHERILEMHAIAREPIQRRRLRIAALAQEAHGVVSMIVRQYEHDVAWLGTRSTSQRCQRAPSRRLGPCGP